jgi:CHAD domain-containing protein
MAYRFKRGDAAVQDGVRRIAAEQIGKAIAEMDDSALDMHDTVHQVRKRCKKLRGLIRLVRPALADYGAENAAFRDAAGTLSFVRDSEALIEAYDSLMAAYRDQIERPAFASACRHLTEMQKAAIGVDDIEGRLHAFRGGMEEAQGRVSAWTLEAVGFAAMEGGLAKTYKRARNAMERAHETPTPEAFHEWRKRAKYHWYHARLLRPVWPGPFKARRRAAKRLSDLLGDHHDLAVLRQTVGAEPDAFGKPADIEVLCGLADRRQAVLAADAFALGARLLAEPPGSLRRRWRAYWTAWRGEQPRRTRALAA